jgi:hypothetical protein
VGAPVLCEMVSNEDCDDNWVHAQFRRRDPLHEALPRYCTGSCNSSFSLRPIKTLAQLDAYLVREGIRAYQLDDNYNLWFSPVIDEEDKRLVWESQHWPGCWTLRGCRQLPPTYNQVGYNPATGWWFTPPPGWLELEAEERQALPAAPRSLAGQLLEIGIGAGFTGYISDLAGELSRRFDEQYTIMALIAAIRRSDAELKLLKVTAESTGKDPDSRKSIWRVVAEKEPSDPSEPSEKASICGNTSEGS